MARVKLSIDFDAFNVYQKKLNEIGGNATKRAVNSALKASQKIVANKVNAAMSTHNKTGEVKETIITDLPVEWTGDTASVPVGFKIAYNGDLQGLPSIFLMYGTQLHGQPHITPDRNLYNAIYGATTRKETRKKQEEAFEKVLERVMKK